MQVPPFKKTLMEAMPYIDFLFGNETEARAFAESESWTTTDVAEIALKVIDCFPFCTWIICAFLASKHPILGPDVPPPCMHV